MKFFGSFIVSLVSILGINSQRPSPCEQGSCYPATGNLLIGRDEQLSATSTCGLSVPEKYCIVSHLQDTKKCFSCHSTEANRKKPSLSHRVENLIYRYFPGTRKRSWWQSENGKEEVSIQLDLEAEFHFTHLIMTFKTFRPAAMFVERSYDFGNSWKIYRYFAYDCATSFPGVPRGPSRNLTDVVCESRYSGVAPSTEGEVIFRVLPPNLQIRDPYAPEVQDLLKITNLRVNFTKLHTLGDDLLDNRLDINQKYYYAVYEMVVRGSCSCYGHASRCLPLDGSDLQETDMVHGRCECTHFTTGLNCERCEDFYNDLPWRPAVGRQSNACKRCNCNNHATSCHFDPVVFEATGQTSGGVCDGCQHNTMGRQCEQCKPYFYQQPGIDIQDPSICAACNCDMRGSLDEGICDSYTDVRNGLDAGQCHCKRHVEGRQCDRCKNGFWNFTSENPDGCQECSCNTLGTVGNLGCDVITGSCSCKRHVIGRDCDVCLPEHYGLSEHPDGCKPCDCDPGGAYDNQCDVVSGQCRCRPNVRGRRCDELEQGYFAGLPDYQVFEAEYSNFPESGQLIIREPYRDGRDKTWSGPGFVRAFKDSFLEFDIDGIPQSMDYDLVIRYEPQLPGRWEDVRVIVDRFEPVDPDGPCANAFPEDDIKFVQLESGSRDVIAYPPTCLERGKKYKVRIEFKSYDTQGEQPRASVLIDSIALIPRADAIPFFHGDQAADLRLQEYSYNRCGEHFYGLYNAKDNVPEDCKKYIFSMGIYTLGSGFECNCDPTGSLSGICDPLGGACQCKDNVVGRQCDKCAPGTYGFSPEGCTTCDCNPVGSLDNFCDVSTGQCRCRPNTYGRQCDQCQPGYWNFPNCQRCECNGHADICDAKTGKCIDCRDATEGYGCDRCLEGYYGDPRLGIDIPCRPCPCPGTADSGHSFASRCTLDPRSQDVICECEEGYAGPRCDVCDDNYYGNPDTPGGRCQPCNCNGNIDLGRPGNCDAITGQCLQCLFNTDGFDCGVCQPGFYGDALNKTCAECTCDILGTDASQGPCDRVTGQCPCLPNVIGWQCDTCAPLHWKLASGEGCEACDCDSIGSESPQCNEYTGQCTCREGFGGRRCDECLTDYWGDPSLNSCQPCDCNLEGSATAQCDRETGKCVCLEGISGYKCDVCDRGYVGQAPQCSPCGECFDNWDVILADLKAQTETIVQSAREIRETGATGAYTTEFENMEERLGQIRTILDTANVDSEQLNMLEDLIQALRTQLSSMRGDMDDLDSAVDSTTQRILSAQFDLSDLRNKVADLRSTANLLKDNTTKLQEANVEGALILIREARLRAQKAQDRCEMSQSHVVDSERQRRRTEALLTRSAEQFNETQDRNREALSELEATLTEMEQKIPDLNDKVCDGRGDPCDSQCGGAGCGKCGALPCDDGAVTKADNALNVAREAEGILRGKQAQAEEMLRGVRQAEQESTEALNVATVAYESALGVKNQSETVKSQLEDLVKQIEDFMSQNGASVSDIRQLANEVMVRAISLQPEQITELSERINDAITSLTNIDDILAATSDDLKTANTLKARADTAKLDAEEILNLVQEVLEALDEATKSQEEARGAIDNASADISAVEKDLAQISSETADAQQKASDSVRDVEDLSSRLKNLQITIVKNDRDVREASREVDEAIQLSERAREGALDLEKAYKTATETLESQSDLAIQARERSQRLQERASRLATSVLGKLQEFKEMEEEYNKYESRLKNQSDELSYLNNRMTDYLTFISEKSEFYRSCQK
ncbi:laminin subunit beta-1-like [Artemia franciscana]|uniref:Laminin subunit beta-1 n=1 Tax=Artemia franciscana TaxID=6661 RepID=A0AA88HXI4_ARTSF|nr:hypothetical protein QYM36_006077 [Artemia franciscana]KAK2718944.1 hypothetical protein QYM36_006077 [Artemia franciscana]